MGYRWVERTGEVELEIEASTEEAVFRRWLGSRSRARSRATVAVDELAVKHTVVVVVDDQLARASVGGAELGDAAGVVERLAGDPVSLVGHREATIRRARRAPPAR